VTHTNFTSTLATHEWAKHQTRKMGGFIDYQSNLEDLTWGIAATTGSITMLHIDDSGLAVSITVMMGLKWWVVMRRRQDGLLDNDRSGDLFTTPNFPPNWTHFSVGEQFLKAEAVHLNPGDVL